MTQSVGGGYDRCAERLTVITLKGKKLDETDSKEFRTNLKDHKANFSGDDYARLLQEFPFLPNRFVITHCNSDYFVKSELGQL